MVECVRADSSCSLWIFGSALPYRSQLLAHWPKEAPLLLVESQDRAQQYRYHKHKLILIFAAMRHFAAWAQSQGFIVDYYDLEQGQSFSTALQAHCKKFCSRKIHYLKPGDFHFSSSLPQICKQAGVQPVEHANDLFLLDLDQFLKVHCNKRHLLMETHYREMRRKHRVLLDERGQPEGGKWNYDASNRKGYKKGLQGQALPPANKDRVVAEVQIMVERHFSSHPGVVDNFFWPVSRKQALAQLQHFINKELDHFGPHQDVMVQDQPFMHHSLLSAALNIGLLHPWECIEAAEKAYREGHVALQSAEAFIRQILGWREFIWGVYWLKMPHYAEENHYKAQGILQPAFWRGDTGLNCVDTVIKEATSNAYAHHIQRLMVMSNLCLLLGVAPKELLGWFMEFFIDAYDWVMVPNVYGMGLFADGGFLATKPYVSSGAYIKRMSNYCDSCRYKVAQRSGPDSCPFNALYWDFIARNKQSLAANPRMALIVKQLGKMDPTELELVGERAAEMREQLAPAP